MELRLPTVPEFQVPVSVFRIGLPAYLVRLVSVAPEATPIRTSVPSKP